MLVHYFYSSVSTLNNVVMPLKESVDWEINTLIWICCIEKKSLMEDEK